MTKTAFLIFGLLMETVTLSLQIWIAMSAPNADIYTPLRLTTYFTVDSNMLLLIYYFGVINFLKNGKGSFLTKPETATAFLTYITFVSIVYHLLLQDVWNPQGLQWWVGELLHWVNPLIFLIFWLIFVDKQQLSFKKLPLWMIFPIIYFFWVLILGGLGLKYPYPFLDVPKLGLLWVFVTGIFLLISMAFIAGTYILLGKKIPKLFNVKTSDTSENHPH
jgi:hypothetical protein